MTGKVVSLTKSVLVIFLLHSFSAALSWSQNIDPALIEQFKKQASSTSRKRVVASPLDKVREADFERRQQSRINGYNGSNEYYDFQDAGADFEVSVIEKDYRTRLSITDIKQFGYDLFRNRSPLNDVVTGVISDDYILGVGDELIIAFHGSKSETMTVNVDREGRVVIPDIRPLSVSGQSLGNFKAALNKQVSDSLIGTDVFVSLATMRMISVIVAGEVKKPGVVRVTSLASPLEILMMAGGVRKMGSLRNLKLVRGNGSQNIDLYDLLVGASGKTPSLRDGDRIVVPTIGATIALAGDVIRPAIYELPAGKMSLSAKKALQLAGGTIRPRGYAFSHIKMDEEGRQVFEILKPTSFIRGGDIILATLKQNAQMGRVELLGHVKVPGVRSLVGATTVRQLLGSLQNLEDDPYLLFGIIDRVDEITHTRQLITFSPEKIMLGKETVALKDQDRVIFLGRKDVDFLTSDRIRQVIFTGEYEDDEDDDDDDDKIVKQCLPLKKLARIISDTQSDRFAVAVRAVFVRKNKEKVRDRKVQQENGDVIETEQFRVNQQVRTPLKSPEEEYLDQVALKELAKERQEEAEAQCPGIYKTVNNLLPLTLEYVVSVDGAVRLPGVYPIVRDTSINSLISVSGGASNDADMSRIEVTSYKKGAVGSSLDMQWKYIDASQTALSDVALSPGGGLRVSSLYTNFESGAVLLSGEFRQPGVYTIRKGERLSTLIKRAGGLTDQSYPYGAIFTRDRVKELQREELRQTSKRLRSAMISASVKKSITADSLFAAQQLTDELTNAELLGRVVIEADPVKLSLDPNIDIVLEAGDTLFMPKRPNFIVTIGDVLNPSALQFVPGKKITDYLKEVGGFSRSADEDRVFVVYPNGVARPVQLSSWGGDRNMGIPPGSAIVVPTDLSPYDTLSLVREIGDIFRNLAVSAASIAVLVRN